MIQGDIISSDLSHEIESIKLLGNFSYEWYQAQALLFRYQEPIKNPVEHYLHHNENYLFDPEPGFDSRFYLKTNKEVKEAGINPYLHYLTVGKKQGRKPFASWTPESISSTWRPYNKKLLFSDRETIEKAGTFNPVYYRHLCDIYEIEIGSMNEIEHYLLVGTKHGMDPEQNFDTRYYMEKNRDVWLKGKNPYVHYIKFGKKAGRRPYRYKFVCREMQHLVIDTDGNISGCSVDVRMLNTFSNIYEDTYAVARKKFEKMRADLFRNPHKYPACLECLHHCLWSDDNKGGLRLVSYCTTDPEPTSANYYMARTKVASTQFHLELSSSCNASCSTCFRFDERFIRKSKETDIDKLKAFFGNEIQDATFVQMFYYGEPFVNKRTGEFLKYVSDNAPGSRIMFSTNGVFLNEDHIDYIIQASRKVPVKIMVSLHGSNQENTRKYMGETFQFNKAIKNLRRLNDKKLEDCDIEITWKYVLFTWNDSDEAISEVKQLAAEIGVQKIHFILTKQPSPSKKYTVGSKAWKDFGKDMVYSQDQVFEYLVS